MQIIQSQIIEIDNNALTKCWGPKNTFKDPVKIDWDADKCKLKCPYSIITPGRERFCMASPVVELGSKQKKRTAEKWARELGKEPAIMRTLFKECKF